jgi:hypothetical protein
MILHRNGQANLWRVSHFQPVKLSDRIQALKFSRDSKVLVAGGTPARFGEVELWDVAARKLQHFGHANQ